jgi:HSP20 family protein
VISVAEDPFELIERRMARLERRFREILKEGLGPTWDLSERALEPLHEVHELKNEVVVTADLPCVHDKQDLEVNCTENSIEIRARMCRPMSFRKWGTVQREADFECYRKVISLPAEVEPEKAKADFKGGILTIRLPRRIRRHKIRVL